MSIAYFLTFVTIETKEQIKIRFHHWLRIAIWIISSDFVDSMSSGCLLSKKHQNEVYSMTTNVSKVVVGESRGIQEASLVGI